MSDLSLRGIAASILLACLAHTPYAFAADNTSIEGNVQRSKDQRPIVGAAVTIKETGATTTTDDKGSYVLRDLVPGTYTLILQVAGGSAIEKQVQVQQGAPATKQDFAVDASVTSLAAVVVLAQRTPTALARAAQQDAPNLINLTTAEEIRTLPDVNAAEAVRRVPGISLETDTGEGRFINIRGLDSDLNSTTFGGLRLPPSNNASPFGGGRAVAMDAIPGGFIGAITVTKTNIPEQDAEALGGTIEITPKTAPQNGARFFEGNLGSGYEVLRGTGIADLSLTAGGRFGASLLDNKSVASYSDRPFSVVATLTYYADKRGIDDIEAAYVDDPAVPNKAFIGFEQRYYQYERKRHGYGLDLGYQPNANNKYYVRAFDAGYTETVNRQRLNWNFVGAATVDPANKNRLIDTIDSFEKTLRDEKEEIDNKVFAIGGKNILESFTLDYRLGYTQGSYDKLYDYNSTFSYSPPEITAIYDNTTDPNYPVFHAVGADPTNPANYKLDKITNSGIYHIRDKERSAAINATTTTNWFTASDEQFKVGLNFRGRDRKVYGDSFSSKVNAGAALTSVISGAPVIFYSRHYNNGPMIDANAARALFPSNTAADPIYKAKQGAEQKEDVTAGYAQYQAGFGALSFIGGARVESTRATYSGNALVTSATGDTTFSPASESTSYVNWFPSLQARYELSRDLISRAAFSSTIARPGFNQVGITSTLEDGVLNIGNPKLKPATANNLDFSIEKYLPNAGIASATLFFKDISNYIALAENISGSTKIISFGNISKSRASGIELNYEQRFKELSGIWNGLGTSINYTFVDSRFEIRPGEFASLPSTSRHTYNLALLYERDGIKVRLTQYYTSRNLFGIGGSAASDVFSEQRRSVDLGSSYAWSKNYGLYFNAKNLTNTPLIFTEGLSSRPIQREFYGITYQAGVNFNF
jgi:TonB-dependent receptor